MSFIDTVRQIDYNIFSKLNGEWHNSFFDTLFPFIRESYIWLPFYFFLILFTTINFKERGWYWSVVFIITASLSDFISSSIIKENFFRLRPCHDPLIADQVRFLVKYCPVSSSFVSSHAVNHFALAIYIFLTLKGISKWWAACFSWAFLISYAQVYVGVHFPADVVCGGLIGLLIGYLPAKLFNKKIGLV
ncbi:MAG: phosphatase PAP2 family protein, partial [Flavisolibacter sp.]